jgi:hypothetical protein
MLSEAFRGEVPLDEINSRVAADIANAHLSDAQISNLFIPEFIDKNTMIELVKDQHDITDLDFTVENYTRDTETRGGENYLIALNAGKQGGYTTTMWRNSLLIQREDGSSRIRGTFMAFTDFDKDGNPELRVLPAQMLNTETDVALIKGCQPSIVRIDTEGEFVAVLDPNADLSKLDTIWILNSQDSQQLDADKVEHNKVQALVPDFKPYEGRLLKVVVDNGNEYIADQFGVKYFENRNGVWIETDDNTRLGHFFEFMAWNKTIPEEFFLLNVVDSFFVETHGAKFFNGTAIGVRMESPPRIERVQAMGTEVDLLLIDVFIPNMLNGVGGRFTVLVDAVPVGGKTYLESAGNTFDPDNRYPTGSPYGTNSVVVTTEAFTLEEKATANMFQQPGRPVSMLFATDVQKTPIEPWKYKWAPPRTDNFKIRYIQEVLLQDPEYRNQLADFKKQLIDMQKKGWAVLVKMQKESGGDNVNIDLLDLEFIASLRIDVPEGFIVPAIDFKPISTRD